MKRIFLCGMLILPLIGVCQQQKFKIKGMVRDVPAKAKAYLFYQVGSTMILDSARLNHGSFEFSGTVDSPMEATVILSHKGLFPANDQVDSRSVYLENGIVRVEGKDSLAHCKIWGTALNLDNQKRIRPSQKQMGLGPTKGEAKAMTEFVSAHPASLVSLDWMRAIGGRDSAVIASYPKLSASLRQTKEGRELGLVVKANQAIRKGQLAPDFSLPDETGKPIKLSSLRGKYVLLEFWASWCKPCRAVQPKLLELYNELKSTGKFTILAVSLDKEQSAWLKAMKEDNVPWLQVADLNAPVNKAAQLYDVTMIPASFLIDPDGRIVGPGPNSALLMEKLKARDGSEVSNGQLEEPMVKLEPQEVINFLSKDNISKADVSEDCDALNKILSRDIGEIEMVKELSTLDMVKDSAAFYGLISTKGVALTREKMKLKQQFVRDHPNSFVSLYLLEENNCMYSADSYALAFQQLAERLRNTLAAQSIRNRIEQLKITPSGKKLQNFTRKDQYGKTVKLSDYKGKLVLLDFWGSWCAVCRESHPHLKELYKTYKDKGLEIIGVANERSKSLTEGKAAWLAAIKKDGADWVQVLNDDGKENMDIVKAYGITTYPTKILLDKNGEVIMRVYSMLNDEMDTLIKTLLEK